MSGRSSTSTPPPPRPRESYTQMAATTTTSSTSHEADLDSIGRHCQHEYCHQLDFLPFRCESCHGTFCLDHRTETAHSCPRAGEWARRRNNNHNQPQPFSRNSTTNPGPNTLRQPESVLPLQKPTIYNSDQCAHVSCKTLINTLKDPGVRCPDCNRQYCLRHRLKEGHDCAKITPLGARAGSSRTGSAPNETIRSMFARVRGWGGSNTTTTTSTKHNKSSSTSTTSASSPSSGIISRFGSKNKSSGTSAAARIAQLNSLKKSAKGDPSVPVDKRLYLHVEGPAERKVSDSIHSSLPHSHSDSDSSKSKATTTTTTTTTTTPPIAAKLDPPSGAFWFDSRWKVGRVLDDAARRLKIENVNNRIDGEEARLRVFHVESGEFLEFAQTIGGDGGRVKMGDTIVLLRGAGSVLGR